MNDFYSLDSILEEMIFARKDKPMAYKRYSKLLISGRHEPVVDFTMKSMIMCFLPNGVPEEELIFRDPSAVSSFFLNLCRDYPWIVGRELTHADATRRYRMALIMRSLFSLKKSLPTINVCKELFAEPVAPIWRSFLALMSDPEPDVRIVCLQTVEVLLKTQIDEQIVSDLIASLSKRLRDVERLIRCESTLVVDHCHRLEAIVDRNLMRHFVARIGDQSLDVRKRALVGVSNVFHTIHRKYHKTEQYFFYKLSTACLLRYTITDIEEEKAFIEMIFVINLLDTKSGSAVKMANLLELICLCDDCGVQSISQVFRNQFKLRTLFAKLIYCTERHHFNTSIVKANHKVYKSLEKAFDYIDGSDDVLKNFHLLLKDYDKKGLDELKCVFETKTALDCRQSVAAIEKLFECQHNSVPNEPLIALKDEIMCRLGVGLMDTNAISELLGLMDSWSGQYSQRLASFVVILSKCYSHYFADHSVICDELLGLPHIILAWIASDSVLPYMQCTHRLKQMITESISASNDSSNE